MKSKNVTVILFPFRNAFPGKGPINRRLIAFVVLILLNVFLPQAQQIYKPKKSIRTEHCWLGKKAATSLRDSIPFSYIRIVDSRYDTTDIGIEFCRFLILRESSQAMAWKQLMDAYYRKFCQPVRDTLILQLEKLTVQDDVTQGQGSVQVEGSMQVLYYKGRLDCYTYMGRTDTVLLDVHQDKTETHWDDCLLKLFDVAIHRALTNTDSTGLNSVRTFSLEEIKKMGLAKREKPILNTTHLNIGFYRDFSELVNNHPTWGHDTKSSLNERLIALNYPVGDHTGQVKPDTSFWGYCDGKHIYLRYAFDCYQLERRDDEFYLAPVLDANRIEANRDLWNFFVGVDALTTSMAANSGPEYRGFSTIKAKVVPKITIWCQDYYVTGIQLDWDSGQLTW
jgi:hypothetical protein